MRVMIAIGVFCLALGIVLLVLNKFIESDPGAFFGPYFCGAGIGVLFTYAALKRIYQNEPS